MTFLCTRSWERLYDIDVLLESFYQAHDKNVKLRLLLVGDGSMRRQIEQYIKDRRLTGIVVTPGMVDASEMPKWFRAARRVRGLRKVGRDIDFATGGDGDRTPRRGQRHTFQPRMDQRGGERLARGRRIKSRVCRQASSGGEPQSLCGQGNGRTESADHCAAGGLGQELSLVDESLRTCSGAVERNLRQRNGTILVRVLVVHPEDSPDSGPWTRERWDLVLDLGRGGENSYERWARQFGCPVVPLSSLSQGIGEFRRIRAFMEAGKGRLSDREGLDWWGLTAIIFHERVELLGLLRRFAEGLEGNAQVFLTRAGYYADALRLLLPDRVSTCQGAPTSEVKSAMHYLGLASKFPVGQLLEIAGDKYDANYSMRAAFASKRRPSRKPVVLLPSAYVNVSKLGLAYARVIPETNFLLVVARRSGWVSDPPPNVATARIAPYVSISQPVDKDYAELLEQWRLVREDLEASPDIALLGRLGLLNLFPHYFRKGLVMRNAWRAVFDTEPVEGVLCGDDTNPITCMPLILARNRGIPTVASHHGALDGRHLIKQNYADMILAKGKMEEDYLTRVCQVSPASVEVGAPARIPETRRPELREGRASKPDIVFFSEGYEVSSGRAEEFYRDVLPPLARLAREQECTLVVKLHPAESRKERETFVARVLTSDQMKLTRVVSGALTDALLDRTWFGVTVLSSTAMECASRGIPCFLCEWLEFWPYGYIEQFARFGAGRILTSAQDIAGIPQILKDYSVDEQIARNLWEPVAPERLRDLLSKQKRAFNQTRKVATGTADFAGV